ncbi:translation initiation factor IF-2-like, partial [Mycetomoellerius zeteki]|uniref:translation initiation factor IF-2-like n=1 Tax=Mycetomoellerius zeteki TaxID=64791 RepID=UPI00084E4A18
MGVAPKASQGPKKGPARASERPPANLKKGTAAQTGTEVARGPPSRPPSKARKARLPSATASPPVTEDVNRGAGSGDKEATWAQVVSRGAKRAAAKAKKAAAAPPQPPARGKSGAAPIKKPGGGTKGNAGSGKGGAAGVPKTSGKKPPTPRL